tara:strand:- start:1151 stop:1381 length:231 start_codon:yes stop_codon:yes gene_type:complete
MDSSFMIALSVSIIYIIFKIIENKIMEQKQKPLKPIFKDSVIVFLSTISGIFIYNQVSTPQTGGISSQVFVDNPQF